MSELILWNKMKNAVVECHSVDEIKQLRDKAEAYRYALKQAKESPEVIRKAEEIKLRAERRAGELLKETPKAKGGNPNSSQPVRGCETLSDMGITYNQSSKWQKIANIPEEKFENYLEVEKELSTRGAIRVARQIERQEEIHKKIEEGRNKLIDIDFRLGDFEEVLSDMPDNSVDCIITDPPYPKEYINCWSKLAKFAKRVLKPNGFCIAYSGQMHLPEVIKRMNEHLDYYWTFALYHEGQTQIVNGVNLICRWKPVLVYQKDKKKIKNTFQDYFISESREKNNHDWQQSKSGVSYLIEMFTNPGDLICEPFAGSGTTILAAINKNRSIIASEIDEDTYNIAKANL
tara:strand:+ start:5809 stop:6846 length:1038 start_codon:yes stop_codon:yes gene_type:complete